jgi:hypothetical protein
LLEGSQNRDSEKLHCLPRPRLRFGLASPLRLRLGPAMQKSISPNPLLGTLLGLVSRGSAGTGKLCERSSEEIMRSETALEEVYNAFRTSAVQTRCLIVDLCWSQRAAAFVFAGPGVESSLPPLMRNRSARLSRQARAIVIARSGLRHRALRSERAMPEAGARDHDCPRLSTQSRAPVAH